MCTTATGTVVPCGLSCLTLVREPAYLASSDTPGQAMGITYATTTRTRTRQRVGGRAPRA